MEHATKASRGIHGAYMKYVFNTDYRPLKQKCCHRQRCVSRG